MSAVSENKARFSVYGRDLYWSFFDKDDGFIRWNGYDDGFWWNNVASGNQFRRRTGDSGRVYVLDPDSDRVIIEEKR